MNPTYAEPPFSDYIVGLDVAKTCDFTAYAVLERSGSPDAYRYDVVGMERIRDRMYPEVVRCVQSLVADPGLRPRRHYPADVDGPDRLEWAPPPTLVLDATGIGDPLADYFMAAPLAAALVPIKITGGSTWRRDSWPGKAAVAAYWVAKGVLVSTVQTLLQSKRLRIIPTLPLAKTLEDELLNFEVRVSDAGNESFAVWRSRKHDDLVLSIALGCFFGELRQVVHRLQVSYDNPLAGRRWGVAEERRQVGRGRPRTLPWRGGGGLLGNYRG